MLLNAAAPSLTLVSKLLTPNTDWHGPGAVMKTRACSSTCVLALVALNARADIRPNTLCTEGMVLQQKATVKIWGEADKGEKVIVSFRGKSVLTEAGADGHWMAAIPS